MTISATYKVLAGGALTMIAALFMSQTVHAIPTDLVGGVSPMPSVIAGGSPQPYHNLILSNHGWVQSVKVGMYWPNDGAKQFKINVGPDCDMQAGSHYRLGKRFLAVEVNNVVKKYFDGSEACNGTLTNYTFDVTAAELRNNFRDSTMYGVSVEMRWIVDSEAGSCVGGASSCSPIRGYLAGVAGGEGSRMRFRYNPLGPNARVGLIDSSNATIGNTNNSIVTRSGGLQDFYFPFGLSCSQENRLDNGLISVYDADNGTDFQNPSLYFYAAKVDASGNATPLSRSEYTGNGGGAATSLNDIWVDETGSPRDRSGVTRGLRDNGPGYPIFTPSNFYNQGGQTSVKVLKMDPHQRYVLIIRNQHATQFTYIGLPGDAIFGSPDFECANAAPPALTPHVDLNGVYEPGGAVDATARVTKPASTADATSNYRRIFWYEDDGNDQYDVGPDTLVPGRDVNSNASYTTTNTTISPTWSTTIPVNSTRKRICTQLQLSSPSPAGTTVSGNPATACQPIIRKPYFQVSLGDANASGVLNCSASPTGTISAFNRGATGPTPWAGAGAQIAAFGAGTITEFTSSAFGKPKILTFANTDASQTYGGSWGLKYCIPDYWAGITSNVNVNFAGENLIETNGDVFINADATFSTTFDMNTLPTRWIKARNIYISNNVKFLDGIFVAKDKIYTCATGNAASPVPVPVTGTPDIVSGCGNPLTVNGALIAGNGVKFQRTAGSLAAPPAESLIYTPEVWLQALKPGAGAGSLNSKWDYVTVLPPVL